MDRNYDDFDVKSEMPASPPGGLYRDVPKAQVRSIDHLGRSIEIMLSDNPGLANFYKGLILRSMSNEAKSVLLDDIKERLGIKPIRRRHLGYVGP